MGQAAQVSVGLADVVARELNARGFTTLTAKADATGIKRMTLDRRLKAEKIFDAEQMAQVADTLGWSLVDLAVALEEHMGVAS